METSFIYIILAAALLVFIFRVGRGRRPSSKRRAELEDIARQLGHRFFESFNLDERGVTVLDSGRHQNESGLKNLRSLQLFSSGEENQKVRLGRIPGFNGGSRPPEAQQAGQYKSGQIYTNLIWGSSIRQETLVFDYSYFLTSGKTSKRHDTTVVVFRIPELELPHFFLRPEKLIHKLGELMGYQDIDFDNHPRFSKMYLLQGDDELAIRLAFRAEIISFFETHPDLFVEARGDTIVFYKGHNLVKPEDLMFFIDDGRKVANLFARR